jgi:capsular exopolysaccharide synthesis family protein
MTRVSEALARAARNAPSGAAPAGTAPLQGPDAFEAELPVDLWPVEQTDGLAAEPPEPIEAAESVPEPAVTPRARDLAAPRPIEYDEKLVGGATLQTAPVEQYRRLAARLHLAQAEAGTRAVMITSAVASEGKTLTATNLALTLSSSYKRRVLLIDADLRRPGVHELFGLPNVTGLNDGVRAEVDRKVPLLAVSEYLSVLTAGRPDPDPMSVLTSDRMRRILADATRSFDWVIVDTPPVAVLSDAHLLTRLVDSVVLVIKAGSTQHAAITRAVEAVGRDRILGVVLNHAEQGRQMAYHYYGYGVRADGPAAE